MSMRRLVATLFAASFLTAAVIPLVTASTEMTTNGDVIVNGAFRNADASGYPTKLYCGPNNPAAGGPNGECAPVNKFVAYDWTTASEYTANVKLVEGGIELTGGAFIQQHFNGTDAPDRLMEFFHTTLTGVSNTGSPGSLRVELRVGTETGVVSYTKSVSFGTSATTVDLGRSDLTSGATSFPAGEVKLRSIRLWSEAGSNLTLSRVSVYATNGIDGRNIHIVSAGDDALEPLGATAILAPGADGKYSFKIGVATDAGEFLPTVDAGICLFTAEQTFEDQGYPDNYLDNCVDAYLKSGQPGVTKTRDGDAFRFDIDSAKATPLASSIGAFSVYGWAKIDGAYAGSTSAAWKTGYFTLARLAADAADAGVSQESYIATPVFADGNADGKPDFATIDEADGYSVIITPQYATETAAATVITPDIDGNYVFDVQVYAYSEDGTGAPMDLVGGIAFGLFDAESATNGGTPGATPYWQPSGANMTRVDAKTWRVTAPGSVAKDAPAGAWAYYNVGEPRKVPATAPVFGSSSSATDFYSAIRNTVKDAVVADSMRTAMTPIVFDSASYTRDATAVIRMDAEADELSPLDGTVVVSDAGDGTITFEYALVVPDGRTIVPTQSHGLALYDAAGVASDDLQPGSRFLEHAEYFAVGTPIEGGWFRVQVPVSAFEEAQGPVGAWAYLDTTAGDGFLLSRSTWYNLLKPAVASISPSAAEKALYGPTPIVLLDEQLGIPTTLASALQGAGSGVLSVTNPLVNPGFEADLQVEGRKDTADSTGATMTSPPWFFRLDDGINGGTQPTNPKSTHEVAAGEGRIGDSALKVRYSFQDNGKGLMLGQLLGVEGANAGLVWKGATGTAFDIKTQTDKPIKFTAALRWLNETDVVKLTTASYTVQPAMGWQRVNIGLNVPAEGRLLGYYLSMDAPQTMTFHLDNIVLQGAKTALGDARTDLSDGYAMIIEPLGLTGLQQGRIAGASGEYFVYDIRVVDYTQGAPRDLPVEGLAKSFGLRTEVLTKDVGTILSVRGEDDHFLAALPVASAPATPAAPWAWVHAGDVYQPFGGPYNSQPASGYYSPVKNALAGASFADQLDYDGTPVAFGTTVAQTIAYEQQLSVSPAPGGGWVVRVESASPYVESTTLTVSAPNVNDRTYPVTLSSASGDIVQGLVLTDAELQTVTLSTEDTIFSLGDTIVAGSPIPMFEVCRVGLDGCVGAGIMSLEDLLFRSTSVSLAGESLTHVWSFGDGKVVTESDAETTHRYQTPGTRTVNLTVVSASGREGWLERSYTVNNRDPTLVSIDIPSNIHRDSQSTIRARATDADGGSLVYTWKIEGVEVLGVTGPALRLTPEVVLATLGTSTLELGTYGVSVSVNDGQGGVPATGVSSFTVVPHAPVLEAPVLTVVGYPEALYALPGETVAVSVPVADVDAQATGVLLRAAAGLDDVVLTESVPGVWTGEFVAPAPMLLKLRGVASTLEGEVVGATADFEVHADTPAVVTLSGPELIQAGESATFTANATDADNRTIGDLAWTEDGVAVVGGEEYVASALAMGVHTIAVTAQGVTQSVEVAVDDVVTVTIEVIEAAETPTDGNLVQVTMVDVNGAPIRDATVVVDDYVSMLPAYVQRRTVHTDENGQATFRLAPEAGGVASLPFEHRLVATGSAPSLAGAPVDDVEWDTAETTYDNLAGPYALTVLP